jgi:hypothetical protein
MSAARRWQPVFLASGAQSSAPPRWRCRTRPPRLRGAQRRVAPSSTRVSSEQIRRAPTSPPRKPCSRQESARAVASGSPFVAPARRRVDPSIVAYAVSSAPAARSSSAAPTSAKATARSSGSCWASDASRNARAASDRLRAGGVSDAAPARSWPVLSREDDRTIAVVVDEGSVMDAIVRPRGRHGYGQCHPNRRTRLRWLRRRRQCAAVQTAELNENRPRVVAHLLAGATRVRERTYELFEIACRRGDDHVIPRSPSRTVAGVRRARARRSISSVPRSRFSSAVSM